MKVVCLRRVLPAILLLALTLPLMGCNKTTFDRVSAGVVVAARLARAEIDGLLAQKLITPEKHAAAGKKIDVAVREAQTYKDQIAQFPVITRQNVGAVIAATNDLLKTFRATLTDPDIAVLSPTSKPILRLSYLITVLEASGGALEVLFPPLTATTASTQLPAREYPATKIQVQLPPKPKGL